ncbi:MAG: hypothetical protein LBO09_01320 [Candidatus Peribacteria bacterium]|jgi:hypothetical protein|nr:hypothetical protein [Candidatus Peribacteria bacterium]
MKTFIFALVIVVVVYIISAIVCALLARLFIKASSFTPRMFHSIPAFFVYIGSIEKDNFVDSSSLLAMSFYPVCNTIFAIVGVCILLFFPIWWIGLTMLFLLFAFLDWCSDLPGKLKKWANS